MNAKKQTKVEKAKSIWEAGLVGEPTRQNGTLVFPVKSTSGASYTVPVNVKTGLAACNCRWGQNREEGQPVCAHVLAVVIARELGHPAQPQPEDGIDWTAEGSTMWRAQALPPPPPRCGEDEWEDPDYLPAGIHARAPQPAGRPWSCLDLGSEWELPPLPQAITLAVQTDDPAVASTELAALLW